MGLAHVPRAAELEVLEAAVVEVAGVPRGRLGHVDPFEQRAVLVAEAEGLETGLGAGVRAAHVVALHLEAGGLGHRRPDVPGVRDVLEEFLGEVHAGGGGLHVHHRRLAGDGDRLFEGADLKGGVHRQGGVQRHLDVLPNHRAEAAERKADRVDPGGQRRERVGALASGNHHPFLDHRRTRGSDRYARKHRSGRVARRPDEAASELLGAGRYGQRERDSENREPGKSLSHESPPGERGSPSFRSGGQRV